MTVVLDSGALIALERNEREMWTALKLAAQRGEDVLLPTTALAQAWRGTARQARLSAALGHCVEVSFDAVAREVGELCGATRTNDIVDAHVAVVAVAQGDVLYTSDPSDLRVLVRACRRGKTTIVRT